MPSPKMPVSSLDLPVSVGLVSHARPDRTDVHQDVLELFDACGDGIRRYVSAFGLGPAATEDVLQEVFLSLFRHLRLGRSRQNLHGWLYRVAHNLSLKQRARMQRWQTQRESGLEQLTQLADPAASPEDRVVETERRERLRAVARALPERDRRCLYLRAEGLCYRDIAAVLGVSLGSVAKSLARAFTRLMNSESR